MQRFSILRLHFLFFVSSIIIVTGGLFDSLLNLAVSAGTRSRSSGPAVEFDEFGGLPQLENTYKAIAKASTVVAIRTVNATLLSFTVKNSSALQVPIGVQSLNSLTNSGHYLLITGLAGDARSVVRHAKQVVLNHTVAFDTVPTGYFIAHEVGKYLQEFTVNGRTRPLACHVFIADGYNEKSLYEIDAAGNVAQIWAGVGGKYMESGRDILENRLNGAAVSSIDEAKIIAESILQGNGFKKKVLFLDGEITEDGEDVVDGNYNTVHFPLYDR
mmetsp:Transcript_7053/g.7160  ORF Transcript_7053/g.7160 Transcript_7053/m.7160 type:complete len:272 (-) Transcript_7053:671-1486(-)